MVIILAGAGVAWWFWGRTLEPARVVQAHLEAIGQHDYPKAYSYFSESAKKAMPLDRFTAAVQANPALDGNYTSEFLDRKLESNVATFSGTVRALGSRTTPATYVVVKEGDRWVIQEAKF
jgi:hypothetical protein